MSDIVERLYDTKGDDIASSAVDAMEDAASEITRLRDELAKAEARAVEAERENFALAAVTCEAPTMDEYGNRGCERVKSVVAECEHVAGEANKWMARAEAAERQLAAAREALTDIWHRGDDRHGIAEQALAAAPAPVSGDEDDDKRECENCGKRAVFDTMHDVGDGAYICEPCYADWKKTFDACDHDWKPGEHDGYQGMYCEKCVGFMREEPAPAPVSGEDDETLTIIARSIGRTIREENHHQRARDVIRSLRERDMTLPTPAPSQNGGE